MADRFDPTAFIEAERREAIATVAATCSPSDSRETCEKPQISVGLEVAAAEQSQESQQSQPKGLKSSIWASGPPMLAALQRPPVMKECDWNRLLRLVKWTCDDWADAAIASGWDPLEFFGCNPDPYAGRLDRDGLVACMFRMTVPVEITAVCPDHVELVARNRDVIRFRPFGPRGQAYLWEAYDMKGGP